MNSKSSQGGAMEDAGLATATYWAPLLETIADIAFAVVIVALAVELVSGRIAKRFERQIEGARELRIAELNNETANLRGSLKSGVLATQANLAASQIMAWSIGKLDREAISAIGKPFLIIQKIEPFAGKQFDAAVTSSDIKLEAFLNSLRSALEAAGWIEVAAREELGDHASVRGIRIDVGESKDSTLLGAANTLASALNAEGIAATVNPKPEANAANANVIHILIGPKGE
jgi:hypothetical protein